VKRLLCTPAMVGMLKERGLTLREIAGRVKESLSLVTRYWRAWRDADEGARKVARSGTRL
jgi:transposase